jgi:hypothetical protein
LHFIHHQLHNPDVIAIDNCDPLSNIGAAEKHELSATGQALDPQPMHRKYESSRCRLLHHETRQVDHLNRKDSLSKIK